ncbi:hypothetical protein PE067_17245 [Paracoccus sp. DMF-8]|uniref:hypothetical protein n=1 Tax=Paracoccus sp. DMF-8 TaxID=3019445 RepID=UPI0023E359F1|nr:hypothetical protein [Paracoccus sp. DMF-8]MDF3607731.1 hypothetical protein [Paracoccus sp. DMF-8]
MLGTPPTVVDGVMRFGRYPTVEDIPRMSLTSTELYVAMAVRTTSLGTIDLVSANNRLHDPWNWPRMVASGSPHRGGGFEALYGQDGFDPVISRSAEGSFIQGAWFVAEFCFSAAGTTVRVIHGTTDYGDVATPLPEGAVLAETTTLFISPLSAGGDPVETDIAALVVHDRIPTPAERASIRAVMAESVPG